MRNEFAAVCTALSLLLIPAAAYPADTKEAPSKVDKAVEKAKEGVEDAAITTKVKAEYAKDKTVSAMRIHVDTDKGVVNLSGNAKTKEESAKAAEIAKSVKGVVSVKNDITVGVNSKKK